MHPSKLRIPHPFLSRLSRLSRLNPPETSHVSHDHVLRHARAVRAVRHAQLQPLSGVLVRGEGSYVWDVEGNRYLDFFPGWGCNLLGHCPPPVVEAVQEQVAKLIHVPNTWHTEAQGQWAKLLSERSFGGQAFFCNSGAEANEAAIKLARLHTPQSSTRSSPSKAASTAARSAPSTATAQPKYHEGLGPLVAGFVYAPFGDLDAVER